MTSDEEHLRRLQAARKEDFASSLPPCEVEPHLLILVKKEGHVSFILEKQLSGERVAVFSVYRREVRQLLERLAALVEKEDGEFTLIEGVLRGGPPRRDQLVNPPPEHRT